MPRIPLNTFISQIRYETPLGGMASRVKICLAAAFIYVR
ncbi:hypothetical protein D1BOALGB6SA_457 [Olavius sp. associated proteobacterium Delta 1]|nr:hypothetical protein D1BOALGB6SA_457 [Olavius sp. associated proteobacterium Delta 1]